MALSYPEGECFFKRSGLETTYYDSNNTHQFYGHFLLEYIWNKPSFHGSDAKPEGYHRRSGYKVVKGSLWNTNYGAWTQMFVMYGKHPYSDYADPDQYRVAEHNLCTSGNRFRDQEKGGSLESFFMVLPMPKLSDAEEWLLIDRTAHIRAIYIPVAQQTSEEHPELCTFLNVNFATGREIRILSHHYKAEHDLPGSYSVTDGTWETVRTEVALGLHSDANWTLAINIPHLVNLLSVPRFLRKHNVFSSKTIRMVDQLCVSTKGNVQKFSDGADIDWTTIVNANFGLTVQWAPPIRNSVTIAAGFMPIVGPIAAVAFPLVFTAITDPASFEATLRSTIPQLDLAKHIEYQLQKSTQDQRSYLSDSWRKSIQGGGGLFLPPTKVPGTSDTTSSRSIPVPQVVKPKPTIPPAPVPEVKKPSQPKTRSKLTEGDFKELFATKQVIRNYVQDTQSEDIITQAEESDMPPGPPQRITILDHDYPREDLILGDSFVEQKYPVLETVENEPLSDLVTSAQFQLADQIFHRSDEESTSTFNATDSTNDPPEEVIDELFPENPLVSDTSIPENDYHWMENYLYDLWFGSEEQTDETEVDLDPEQGTEMEQEAEEESGYGSQT
ncbi:uncharacterized protein N7506_011554 [Penicillium brevicompactum]|uniref:uncharacterized protein n=1 Tax=Penicillium brevicompactum TaxID=5074 RepID=UPI0025419663|nr:uncharacterized protein N7506_011554 [Penicillium brevicompactum]KAJ5318850.1 hypothetical protein N7506_011554 [Penicillium brevicompactum]